MGIPLGGGRRGNRRRRSYADYKPYNNRNQRPSSDPFRIFFYLMLIGGLVWGFYNQDTVKQYLSEQFGGIFSTFETTLDSSEETESAGKGDLPARATATPNYSESELIALAEQAYQEGHLPEAIDYYQQLSELSPQNVDYPAQAARLLLFQSAMEYGMQREQTLEDATEAANKAILADPYRPEGYAILGKVFDWKGQPERGMSELQRALEIDENYALAHSYLAEVLIDLDRYELSEETAEKAVNLAPDHVDVRRDYAYVLESQGDYYGAATQYETAVQIHPNLPYLLIALARNYRLIGRYQESLDYLFSVEVLEPSNALVPFEVGQTYETYIGDPNSALEYYERAVELDDLYPYPWMRIGAIRYIQGNYQEAIPAYEHAIEMGIDTVTAYFQLGMAYALEGNCDKALDNLAEAQIRAEGDEALLDAIEDGLEICPGTFPDPTPTDEP